jgi:hypothetical protein
MITKFLHQTLYLITTIYYSSTTYFSVAHFDFFLQVDSFHYLFQTKIWLYSLISLIWATLPPPDSSRRNRRDTESYNQQHAAVDTHAADIQFLEE